MRLAFLLPLVLLLGAQDAPTKANCRKAADYSSRSGGRAVVVMVDGEIVFERYDNGFDAETGTHLHSGTKGFWGPVVAAMIEDGLVSSFDEPAHETLPEWKDDSKKKTITLRHLLSLSAGLAQDIPQLQGWRGKAKDKYKHAIGLEVNQRVGRDFRYGPSCYYALGEIMKRKLKKSPLEYLKERILDPIGCEISEWKHDPSGNPHIPNGATLTARNWLKFGQFLLQKGKWKGKQIIPKKLFEELVKPSKANKGHGLTLWLNTKGGQGTSGVMRAPTGAEGGFLYPAGHTDLFAPLGAGKCRMYIIPSMKMVAVRQCDEDRDTYQDGTFLSLLLEGKRDAGPKPTAEDEKWRKFTQRARKMSREMNHDGKSRAEIRRAIVDLAEEMGLDPSEIRDRMGR